MELIERSVWYIQLGKKIENLSRVVIVGQLWVGLLQKNGPNKERQKKRRREKKIHLN